MNLASNIYSYVLMGTRWPQDQLPICAITSDGDAYGSIQIGKNLSLISTIDASVYRALPPVPGIQPYAWTRFEPAIATYTDGTCTPSCLTITEYGNQNGFTWSFNPIDATNGQYYSLEFFLNQDSSTFNLLATEIANLFLGNGYNGILSNGDTLYEIRISSTTKSNAYITYTYNNLLSSFGGVTWSSQQIWNNNSGMLL